MEKFFIFFPNSDTIEAPAELEEEIRGLRKDI